MIPGIRYQSQSTGSIFDFCENRADIVLSLRDPHIDPENRARIPPRELVAVESILKELTRYKGSSPKKRRIVLTLQAPDDRANLMAVKSGVTPEGSGPSSPEEASTFQEVLKTLNSTLPELPSPPRRTRARAARHLGRKKSRRQK